MIKKITTVLCVAAMLMFAACGGGNKNANGQSTGTEQEVSKTDGGSTAVKYKNGYPFPKLSSQKEWPAAQIWETLGVPNLVPAKMEKPEIYNDGSIYIEDYTHALTAECISNEASFQTLASMLWGKGFKGLDIGGGRIVPAHDQLQLMETNPNYQYYRAYYVHNGDWLMVQLQYAEFCTTLWVSIQYAPTKSDFEQYPKIKFPSAEIKKFIGVEMPNPGGNAVYGKLQEDEITLYIEGVSQSTYDAYLKRLEADQVPGIIVDKGDPYYNDGYGISEHYYTSVTFYPADYENYPRAIRVNYVEGIVVLAFVEI